MTLTFYQKLYWEFILLATLFLEKTMVYRTAFSGPNGNKNAAANNKYAAK